MILATRLFLAGLALCAMTATASAADKIGLPGPFSRRTESSSLMATIRMSPSRAADSR